MNRIAIMFTAALIAGAVTVKFTNTSERLTMHPLDGVTEEQRVDDYVTRYYHFKTVMDESMASLEKNEITLKEAVARVVTAAHAEYPAFLRHLEREEPGLTDSERVAHNLVGHLRGNQELKPNLPARMPALEVELANWQ